MTSIFNACEATSERALWRGYFLYSLALSFGFGFGVVASLNWNLELGRLHLAIPLGVLFVIALIWLIRTFVKWKGASPHPMSPEERKQFGKRWEGLEGGDWLMRYSVAACMLLFALLAPELFHETKNLNPIRNFIKEWGPVIFVLIAAFWGWEVTATVFVGGLLVGLLYLLFLAVAALPVSVSIVIGACIIAYAIYRRGGQR